MTTQRPRCILLDGDDAVAVTVADLAAGEPLGIGDLKAGAPVPAGHKVAVNQVNPGEAVTKYGQIIGFATRPIAAGDPVHTENLAMGEYERAYASGVDHAATDLIPEAERATFDGFRRADGTVGTRNYIGVLATVSCSTTVAHHIARAVTPEILAGHPSVDGVVALGHGAGCCMSPDGEGLAILRRTMAGYARNPNFGGILLVGLGCEVNLVDDLMARTGLTASPGMVPLDIQTEGGTRRTVERAVAAIREMLPAVGSARRTTVPASHLVVGLECGGSDAYSGITANPALGAAVDRVVRNGGTAILSETPEIYGAEHLLIRRAATPAVGRALLDRIAWWRTYTRRHGAEIDNNPTPGNKAGGLTTILEKSLGAVAKGGTTGLNGVYRYAEPVAERGLVFMDTPGYDVVSITGMIAGGANLVCFTTGRGTVCGFKPVPTLKIATNSPMYRRMAEDMDIDCGQILEGGRTLPEMGEEIFRAILRTASGEPTKSEVLDFGGNEFAPWPMGAVL